MILQRMFISIPPERLVKTPTSKFWVFKKIGSTAHKGPIGSGLPSVGDNAG